MTPLMLTPLLFAQSDAQLIELARAGHERAFEVLVRRYRAQLLAHCRHIAAGGRAEDALQYGLLGAWLALQNGTRVAQARPWLYRVVHNACLRTWRDGRDAELSESVCAADGPEEQFDRAENLRQALRALSALPELQRDALVQTALEGRSYENVADDLGVTPAALRGLLYRARANIRSAVSAVTPTPLLGWLLARGAPRAAKPAAAGLSAGGASGSATLVTKGAVAVLSAGALAAGAGVAHFVAQSHPHARIRVAAVSPRARTARPVADSTPELARPTAAWPASLPAKRAPRVRMAPQHRSASRALTAAIVTAVAAPRPAAVAAPRSHAPVPPPRSHAPVPPPRSHVASAAPTARPAAPAGSSTPPQGGQSGGSSHHDGQGSSDGSHTSSDSQRSNTDGSSSNQTSSGSDTQSPGGGTATTTGTGGDG